MTKNTKIILVILAFILAIGIFSFLTYLDSTRQQDQTIAEIKNFQECLAAGYPVMESYPRQCSANDQTFSEDIGNELAKSDLIIIDNPRPNQTISSPLTISGKARGYWYFEADFPVILYDAKGKELGRGIAQAQSEWMTEDFVEFKATLKFDKPETKTGNLILEKDNPSGLPEYNDQLRVPVNF